VSTRFDLHRLALILQLFFQFPDPDPAKRTNAAGLRITRLPSCPDTRYGFEGAGVSFT